MVDNGSQYIGEDSMVDDNKDNMVDESSKYKHGG